MQFLNLPAFWLALLAVPILLLYMLKLRRKQMQVSSTMLWTQLLRDRQANTPWQKLRRNLLLILQLIILAALVLSLARPSIETTVVASGSVIVLLDASASMNAADVSRSRFESARGTIQDLIEGLSSNSKMTLILVGQTPETLITAESDKSLLKKALARAQATQGSVDWQAAFSLAAGAARGSHDDATIIIISDGGLPESGLPALPADVRYVPVGKSDDNIGVTALALRRLPSAPEMFAEVTNFSDAERSVLISFYFNDELFSARQLDLPPNSIKSLTVEKLSNVSGVYKVRISNPKGDNSVLDAFPLDDDAFAVYQSASARRVLLVSKGNIFLEQLLASMNGIHPFRALPAQDGTLQIPSDPFDLYIFDGFLPASLPSGNLLLINAPSNSLFTVGGIYKEFGNVVVKEHPLTRFVDWGNVRILQARKVQTPAWAENLIETESGALLFAGETEGRRVAALTFDLHESDLPLQIAFPILFTNLINYLSPSGAFDATESLHVGESLEIHAEPDVEEITVSAPSKQTFTFNPRERAVTFTQTRELGYYTVTLRRANSTALEYFAVNLFDLDESNIQPREKIQIGRAEVSPAASNQIGLREIWSWLTLIALIVLMIEWQAYHRKPLIANR